MMRAVVPTSPSYEKDPGSGKPPPNSNSALVTGRPVGGAPQPMRARVDRSSTKESGAVVIEWLSALLGWWGVGGEHVDEGARAGRDPRAAAHEHPPGGR